MKPRLQEDLTKCKTPPRKGCCSLGLPRAIVWLTQSLPLLVPVVQQETAMLLFERIVAEYKAQQPAPAAAAS